MLIRRFRCVLDTGSPFCGNCATRAIDLPSRLRAIWFGHVRYTLTHERPGVPFVNWNSGHKLPAPALLNAGVLDLIRFPRPEQNDAKGEHEHILGLSIQASVQWISPLEHGYGHVFDHGREGVVGGTLTVRTVNSADRRERSYSFDIRTKDVGMSQKIAEYHAAEADTTYPRFIDRYVEIPLELAELIDVLLAESLARHLGELPRLESDTTCFAEYARQGRDPTSPPPEKKLMHPDQFMGI